MSKNKSNQYNNSLSKFEELKNQLKKFGVAVDFPPKRFVIILFDCSTSMSDLKLREAKLGAGKFIKKATQQNYLVGLVSFGSTAKVISELTYEYNKVIDSLTNLTTYGSTNLSDGIKVSDSLFPRLFYDKYLVIITDGMPDNRENALSCATQIKNKGVEIITIGTDDADTEFLNELASNKDRVLPCSTANLAQTIVSSIKLLPQNSQGG